MRRVLACLVALLARKLLHESRWPCAGARIVYRTVARTHKRKSRADVNNYRGVHLTTQVSNNCFNASSICISEAKQTKLVSTPAKESTHILALTVGEGQTFRLLGVPFDNALAMRDAVVELVSEAVWKIASILRSGRFFTNVELVNL